MNLLQATLPINVSQYLKLPAGTTTFAWWGIYIAGGIVATLGLLAFFVMIKGDEWVRRNMLAILIGGFCVTLALLLVF